MFFKRRHQHFFIRRIAHTVNLKRERRIILFSRVGSAVLFGALLIFVVVYSFQGGATTAQLYPGACSGTWVQPAHAQGKPDLDQNASPGAFTPNNSAFVVRDSTDQKQIFCSNFSGDPLLASSSPQLVTLRLSWAIGPKDHTSSSASGAIVQQVVNFAPSPQVLEEIASSSASSAPASISDTSSAASSTSSSSTASGANGKKDVGGANPLTATSSSNDIEGGEEASAPAGSSSSTSSSQPSQGPSQTIASTTSSSASTVPDASASNVSPSPATDATSSSVSSPPPAPAPASAPAPTSVSAPASSSTSLLWNLLSPFFLRAFAQEVSTTPLVDATASTPVLISAPTAASSSPFVASTTIGQLSATATPADNESASVSLSAVSSSTTTAAASSSSDQVPPPSASAITLEQASSTASSSRAGTQSSASGDSASLSPASAPASSAASSPGVAPIVLPAPAAPVASDPTSTPHSDATSTPAVPMFEIRYSLDGSTWDVLADVTPDQMGQTFVVPVLSNDSIGKLQIAIVTLDLSPLSLDQAAYVDGMTLQVTYPNGKENDVNQLSSHRKQLVSSDGAFDAVQLRDDDFSRAGTRIVSCAADPFSQTVAVNGTAQYAINLSGPSDAQFDFSGIYGTLLTATTTAPTSSAILSAPSTSDTGTASLALSSTPLLLSPGASTSTASDTTHAIVIATDTLATTSGPTSSAPTDAPALSRLMPFLITLGDYPQGIVPVLSQNASGTPLVLFSADKTALPGSYTLIVRVLAKYHGQVQKGLCQLNLIVK